MVAFNIIVFQLHLSFDKDIIGRIVLVINHNLHFFYKEMS